MICNFKAVLVTYHGINAGTWQPHNGPFGRLMRVLLTTQTAEIARIGYAKYLGFLYCSDTYISYNNYTANSQSTRGITSIE